MMVPLPEPSVTFLVGAEAHTPLSSRSALGEPALQRPTTGVDRDLVPEEGCDGASADSTSYSPHSDEN